MRKIIALILTAAMLFTLTACAGVDTTKLNGAWTVKLVGGSPVEDAAVSDLPLWTIDGDTVKIEKGGKCVEYGVKPTSGGFEATDNGAAVISVTYNEKDDRLKYSLQEDGKTFEYTLVRYTAEDTEPEAAPAQ